VQVQFGLGFVPWPELVAAEQLVLVQLRLGSVPWPMLIITGQLVLVQPRLGFVPWPALVAAEQLVLVQLRLGSMPWPMLVITGQPGQELVLAHPNTPPSIHHSQKILFAQRSCRHLLPLTHLRHILVIFEPH